MLRLEAEQAVSANKALLEEARRAEREVLFYLVQPIISLDHPLSFITFPYKESSLAHRKPLPKQQPGMTEREVPPAPQSAERSAEREVPALGDRANKALDG